MANAWPELHRGSRGPDVTTVQYILRAAREASRHLKPDGDFGPKTEHAVREFQEFAGIAVDGIVGPVTWGKLTDGHTVDSTVRRGDEGDFVRAAQTELVKQGYLKAGGVDGDFGPKTEAAVRRFQEDVGLNVDGVVGPKTWRQLVTHRS
ncbi:peptidoglycan-binding domain-containing protein [Actinomadura oligospora]|uniref:peptidoglycan-binding domain-containing protein n=1 Tax=Actinomadura oligospora TaxID=111804 RepID=UPI000479DE56|nr:peptidoglycan-binding protein [Actinomadura oligospora]